ncbi:helix-turn-helix domain-containing protein [Lacticaseibacillus saniviri]|uniref:helix-turn-helix domain-containing protein n=1 Tax=Lacticaseibacillus saniviri TaxID=931533 RepID=UPI001EDF510E|nr:helix-turn-helix domain-containing protein [Lacticaseibacillus saniviri]
MNNDMLRMRLIDLRESKNLTQSELARQIKMDNTAISKIEKGTRKVSAEELLNFSKFYNVSTDFLLGNTDKEHYYSLTEKDNKAIDAEIEEILSGMSDSNSVNFFKSNPDLSDRDKELLEVSLRQSLELAREMAKKKFTPKKYRGSESD